MILYPLQVKSYFGKYPPRRTAYTKRKNNNKILSPRNRGHKYSLAQTETTLLEQQFRQQMFIFLHLVFYVFYHVLCLL